MERTVAVTAGALAALTLALAVLLLASPAEAEHYRGGTLWVETDAIPPFPPDDPYKVRLRAQIFVAAWALGEHSITIGGPAPPILRPLCFGDGTCTTTWTGRIISFDREHEVVGIEAWGTDLRPGVPHTYAHEGPWTYWYGTSRSGETPSTTECCRLGFPATPGIPTCRCGYLHPNNPDTPIRLEGSVELPLRMPAQPHKSDLKPIVRCDNGTPMCVIRLPPALGYPEMRFATAEESSTGSVFYQPGPCPSFPSPCSIPSSASICQPFSLCWPMPFIGVTWPGKDYYSVTLQYVAGPNRSPVEFMIHLELYETVPPPCGGKPLVFCVPPLKPDFEYRQGSTCGPDPVQFLDRSEKPTNPLHSIVGWHWTFGDPDATISTMSDPTHQYPPEGGTYEVTLTLRDNYWREFSVTKTIVVAAESECGGGQETLRLTRPTGIPRDGVDLYWASLDSDDDGVIDRDDACPGPTAALTDGIGPGCAPGAMTESVCGGPLTQDGRSAPACAADERVDCSICLDEPPPEDQPWATSASRAPPASLAVQDAAAKPFSPVGVGLALLLATLMLVLVAVGRRA